MADLVLTAPEPDVMLTMIERAVMSPDFDVDKLQQMLQLRERYEAAEAKRAYDAAKAKFGAFAIQVSKDKTNTQYNSNYTSIGNLVNTVTPFLAQCELNARWEIDQSNGIKVTCILSHVAGHSERVALTVPPDDSGKKNPLQQIKSAITYAKICTFESICGLASREANLDDDGNASGGSQPGLDTQYVQERIEDIKKAASVQDLWDRYKGAYKEAMEMGDKQAQSAYLRAKDARKKELQNA